MTFSHHAYIIKTVPEKMDDVLAGVAEETGMVLAGNPDIWQGTFETLGIDDARMLVERAARRPAAAAQQLFFIGFRFATIEAQNALLKLLEEPTGDSVFFLITPSGEHLLPTLRSRLQKYELGIQNQESGNTSAKKFLNASISVRLEILKDIIEEKDKGRAVELLNGIETLLSKKDIIAPELSAALRVVEQARDYLHDRAPSVKMLLEHVALRLPTIS